MKSSTRTRAKESTAARWTAGALMTPQPLTIGRNESLMTAHRLMNEHRIRHLPVLEHGELIGIVSQRDLYFLETIRGVDIDTDTVEDAMTSDTYGVAPDAPISAVAKHMARHRYGCAVVLERGKVAGIFTATDALRLVSTLTSAALCASHNASPCNPSRLTNEPARGLVRKGCDAPSGWKKEVMR